MTADHRDYCSAGQNAGWHWIGGRSSGKLLFSHQTGAQIPRWVEQEVKLAEPRAQSPIVSWLFFMITVTARSTFCDS
jgi:hypothetical protein